MSFRNIKNIPINVGVRQGYSGLDFPLKLENLLPKIVKQPIPLQRALNPGLSTVFTVEAVGIEPLEYQWYRGNKSFPIGTNTKTLNVTSVSAGSYFVEVSNPFGSVESARASVTINTPAGITAGPDSLTAFYFNEISKDVATFSVIVSGTPPFAYSWYKNSNLIPTVIGSSVTTNFSLSDSGSEYTVVVKNFSTPVSGTASLTILNAPLGFVLQPTNQNANPGDSSVTFTALASGRAPITYQWRKNGENISGQTTRFLVVTGIEESSEAAYDVVVSALSGIENILVSLTSNSAQLYVNDPIGITAELPTNVFLSSGEVYQFNAQLSGTTPYSYQWYKDAVIISGATSSSLSITSNSETIFGDYYYTASNIVNSVTSNTSTVANGNPPGIISPTETFALSVNPGSNLTLTVEATGTLLEYQWKKNETIIPLATSASLTLNAIANSDAGSYINVVSNIWGTASSAPYVIGVNKPVTFLAPITGNEYFFPGTEVVFYTSVTGTAPITYQWYRNNEPIVDANTNIYTIPSITPEENGDQYQLVVSNIVNTASSLVIILSVYQPVNILEQPVSLISAFDATNNEATFTVKVSGDTPYVFNWYKNNSSVYTGGSSYTVDSGRAISATDFGTYFVTISNIVQMVTSNSVVLGGSVPSNVVWEFDSPTSTTNLTNLVVSLSSGNISYIMWGDGTYDVNISTDSNTNHTYTV